MHCVSYGRLLPGYVVKAANYSTALGHVWMVLRRCLLGSTVVAMLLAGGAVSAGERIALYTYHLHVPFITAQGEGLTYDLARYLTEQSDGAFTFEVMPISRPRLNNMLDSADLAVVPWVNPAWFGDIPEERFTWFRGVLMRDANALLSRHSDPVFYQSAASLDGLSVGGLYGHHYTDIDQYVAGSEVTRRVDSDTHAENLNKLMDRRIDVMLIPDSSARLMVGKRNLREQTFISPIPHASYDRRLMMSGNNSALQKLLATLLEGIESDDAWQQIVSRYQ